MSKSLIIDPGHGGTDPGANGFGAREKDWTLKISLYQYNRLKELGANVAITRTNDKTLDSVPRTNLIKSKYNYCMSNHFNAFNGSARGVETIHSIYSKGVVAKKLADTVVNASGLPLRRVFDRKGNAGDYYFMHRLTGSTETIIVEYGFIDNKADHDFYKNDSNFYRVAEAVVKAWCDILGVKYVAPGKNEGEPNPSGTYTVKSGDTLWDIAKDHGMTVNDLKKLNGLKGDLIHPGDKLVLSGKSKPKPSKPKPTYIGKRVESIHNGQLRFYNKASWSDAHVAGYLDRGYGFPTIVSKVKVGSGEQYKVKNSKGATYYVTASGKYVRVI